MKKLMMLFLLVSFMCFGEEKAEPNKSYEAIQREEINFLKTQLIKSNNKIDDLSEKIEKLEDKGENNFTSSYSVDQIYQNSVQYYDKALEETKWLIERVGGIISLLLAALLGSTWYIKKVGDKELKEKIQKETLKVDEKFNKRINEYDKKMLESEEKVESLKQEYEKNIISIKKDVREVQYNTELAIAINKSKIEDKIIELKKLIKKYPKKAQIYFELGSFMIGKKNYKEAISNFNMIKKLKPKNGVSYNIIGLGYEAWGTNEGKNNNSIVAKQYFEEAIKNYKEAIKLDPNDENYVKNKGIVEEKLKELKGK